MARQAGKRVNNTQAESELRTKVQTWLDMLLHIGLPVPQMPSDKPWERTEVATLLKNGGSLPRKPGERACERCEAFFRRAGVAARHSSNAIDFPQSGITQQDISSRSSPSLATDNADMEGQSDVFSPRKQETTSASFESLPASSIPMSGLVIDTTSPSPLTYRAQDRRPSFHSSLVDEVSLPFQNCKADL